MLARVKLSIKLLSTAEFQSLRPVGVILHHLEYARLAGISPNWETIPPTAIANAIWSRSAPIPSQTGHNTRPRINPVKKRTENIDRINLQPTVLFELAIKQDKKIT